MCDSKLHIIFFASLTLVFIMIDRRLASVPKTIEVVKISFPQGLF